MPTSLTEKAMPDNVKPHDVLARLIDDATAHGADAADALYLHSEEVQAACRHAKPETLERAESSGVGLRVWVGQRLASASSSDCSASALNELAERVIAMARAAPEDADTVLAEAAQYATHAEKLQLCDTANWSPQAMMETARDTEAAALAVAGVTNSEGAEASASTTHVALMTSPHTKDGFFQQYSSSMFALSASVLAGEGAAMERDYDYATTRFLSDLPKPETIGGNAARLAVKRLKPRRVPSGAVPVVFDPRVGKSLLASFASAISGAAVARGTSFLKNAMGEALFANDITISDDPHRLRGLASRPFDAEGVKNPALDLVKEGRLQHWLLDCRSAKKLGLASNGRASRGLSGAPSPTSTNLYLHPGALTPEALLKDIGTGFYVTETIGMGVNLITGDYSQGAAGFWIEDGEIAYPVSEVTIAGHLREMFASLRPANDLMFRYGTNAPTFAIERMMVAGA